MSFDAFESDYPTCERCYVTLCIYTGDNQASDVTKVLGLQPSEVTVKGESASFFSSRINPLNGWFLSSRDHLSSKDFRNHLDWLFDKIAFYKAEIQLLRSRGFIFSVSGYWLSRAGHGGPILSTSQIKKLAEFEFDISLDIYFLGDETGT
jgi:hypothetical protein